MEHNKGMSPRITLERTSRPQTRPPDSELKFGRVFTDHMFLLDYKDGAGWKNPRIVPFGPLSFSPAAAGLHYGQTMFDGLKALRGGDPVLLHPHELQHRLAHQLAIDRRHAQR